MKIYCTRVHIFLISLFITSNLTHPSDYWPTIRNTPSCFGQLIMRNKIRTALLGAGAFSLYYFYNNYMKSKAVSLTKEEPKPLIIPQYEPDEVACDKDVCFYKFTGKKWRDVSDIRREFEKPENFNLLTSGFVKPSPIVDVKEGEHPDIYDIRNILLPPEPLLRASRVHCATNRSCDADKYETAYNKMTYIMRKKDKPHDFIGFTTFYKKPYNTTEAHIDLVLISKKFRGQGYGPLMLNFAFDAMKKMGITKVELITAEENKTAQHLYEKVGFIKPLNQPYRNQNHISYERNI